MRDVLVEEQEWSVRVRASTRGAREGWNVRGIRSEDRLYVALVDYSETFCPVVYVLSSKDVLRATLAEVAAFRILKPRQKEASMRMIHDPLPDAITGYPNTSPYKSGWLEAYREAWHRLPGSHGKDP